jgi:hypothetical protein
MRGQQERSGSLFFYVSIEERIPTSHPLRRIHRLADQALDRLNPTFCRLYDLEGRPLAERLGRTIRDTNRSLAAFGLQLRNDEDDWQLTEAGRDWGIALSACSRGERKQQILWDPAVVLLLQGET